MDLALRLSEQEASIVAIKRQKEEEEAMKKAIQESVSTTPLPVCKYGPFVSQFLSHPLKRNFQPSFIMSVNQSRDLCRVLCSVMKSVLVLSRWPSRISRVLLQKVRACWMKRMLPPSSALAGNSRTQMEGRARSVRRHQAAPQRRSRNEVKPRILLGFS